MVRRGRPRNHLHIIIYILLNVVSRSLPPCIPPSGDVCFPFVDKNLLLFTFSIVVVFATRSLCLSRPSNANIVWSSRGLYSVQNKKWTAVRFEDNSNAREWMLNELVAGGAHQSLQLIPLSDGSGTLSVTFSWIASKERGIRIEELYSNPKISYWWDFSRHSLSTRWAYVSRGGWWVSNKVNPDRKKKEYTRRLWRESMIVAKDAICLRENVCWE